MRGLVCLVICLSGTAGQAYSLETEVDGRWCRPNSVERITVEGLSVITPSGNSVLARPISQGLEYDVPEGERPHEGRITLEPVGSLHLNVSYLRKIQKEPPAHDLWRRCEEIG